MIDKALHIMDIVNKLIQPLFIAWLAFDVTNLKKRVKKLKKSKNEK